MPPAALPPEPPTIRPALRPLNLRERRLLALAAWVLAIFASIGLAQKFMANGREIREIRETIAGQQPTLDTLAAVSERLDAHARRMASTKDLDLTELQTLVDGFARSIRLVPETVTPKSETKGSIQILTVRLVFRNATMDRLLLLEDKLRGAGIPLTVTTTRLDASRDGTVTASCSIATYRMEAKTTAGHNLARAAGKPQILSGAAPRHAGRP
ncbi:MAG: hypothetical protein LBG65_06970 [Puniceicoccales bacterium]|jgi:hypothetical protein|nr:hypothetical protein [Puniceicoccales bacterium]